jgi:hypothetical protein
VFLYAERHVGIPHFEGKKPNAGHEPRPKAEAQRKLEGVGSMLLFGKAGRVQYLADETASPAASLADRRLSDFSHDGCDFLLGLQVPCEYVGGSLQHTLPEETGKILP